MAHGKEEVTLAIGTSTERTARQGHDTKRSDWRDPDRRELGRQDMNNHTTTPSHET